jgi:rare lipoprotein A (peptidoglycan hydrolase)
MAWKLSTWAKRVRLASIATIATAIAAIAIPATTSTPTEAKTPGKTYCFVGKCHRVKTIEETAALVGVEQNITASHYDDCSKDRYNPCGLTSSGERFHPDRPDNTASPIYPDGTQLLVWSPKNKRALVVRVNNAGPYWGNRTLDLSRAAAEKLGFEGEGVANLKVKVIKAPELAETQYKKNREYDPVPGDIGQYASVDDAQRGMAVVLAFKATTGSPFAPVTTANAFSGQSVGAGNMLVAEAPQAIGRVMTIAYSPAQAPVAFGGFTTQSHSVQAGLSQQSRALRAAANQSHWDEDRVIDGPVKLSVASETSSITPPKKVAKVEAAKAKLASAAYDDEAKPAKKKRGDKADTSSKGDKAEKSTKTASKSKRSRRDRDRDVASYEGRSSRGYREERGSSEYRPRVAYQSQEGYSSHSDGGRSAGQTMQDNFRPL